MSKPELITDPGAGLDHEAAKAARKAAWKRESTKAARKAARDKRIEAWKALTGLKWEGEK